jgi:hypothetical protein
VREQIFSGIFIHYSRKPSFVIPACFLAGIQPSAPLDSRLKTAGMTKESPPDAEQSMPLVTVISNVPAWTF